MITNFIKIINCSFLVKTILPIVILHVSVVSNNRKSGRLVQPKSAEPFVKTEQLVR